MEKNKFQTVSKLNQISNSPVKCTTKEGISFKNDHIAEF